jgi:signal transduction histidine kinase
VLGSVTVRSDIGDRVEVCGDRDSLVNILDNLTRNAVTAMGGAGEIGIVFEKSGPTGHLVFRDTGPGVPPSIRESLFDPFVSGSKSGTGLGLAIVRTLCERSGWSIALRGGEAAAFEITFGEGTWRES